MFMLVLILTAAITESKLIWAISPIGVSTGLIFLSAIIASKYVSSVSNFGTSAREDHQDPDSMQTSGLGL